MNGKLTPDEIEFFFTCAWVTVKNDYVAYTRYRTEYFRDTDTSFMNEPVMTFEYRQWLADKGLID